MPEFLCIVGALLLLWKITEFILNIVPNAEARCPKCKRLTYKNIFHSESADVWECTWCKHRQTYVK